MTNSIRKLPTLSSHYFFQPFEVNLIEVSEKMLLLIFFLFSKIKKVIVTVKQWKVNVAILEIKTNNLLEWNYRNGLLALEIYLIKIYFGGVCSILKGQSNTFVTKTKNEIWKIFHCFCNALISLVAKNWDRCDCLIKPDMWMFTQVLKRITRNKKSPVLLRDSPNFPTKQVPWNYD